MDADAPTRDNSSSSVPRVDVDASTEDDSSSSVPQLSKLWFKVAALNTKKIAVQMSPLATLAWRIEEIDVSVNASHRYFLFAVDLRDHLYVHKSSAMVAKLKLFDEQSLTIV
jgi:hypothetical protein